MESGREHDTQQDVKHDMKYIQTRYRTAWSVKSFSNTMNHIRQQWLFLSLYKNLTLLLTYDFHHIYHIFLLFRDYTGVVA